MKEYKESKPAVVIGGACGDFLGEYMAGGTQQVLLPHIPGPYRPETNSG
jgi:hypothetical protein